METFGQKMRQAVASQGLRLDQLVKETGLPIEHIQALGCDDFAALPDDDVVENGLRSFAQFVGVEPEQVIEDYRSERQRWLESAPTVEAAPPEPLEEDFPAPGRGRATGVAGWALAAVALAAVTLFWLRSSATGSGRPAAVENEAPITQAAIPRIQPTAPVEPAPAIEPAAGSSHLSIPAHGVGRDVVDHELVGEAGRFAEGERIWFWTRIEGAEAGESVDHIWLHEGVESLRVSLKLGGARWRTHSYKHMVPGSSGRWTVEARDETGRVLARREFVCSPAG